MPVTMTYNITYNNLLYINAACWFSSTASAQEQIIVSSITNSSCIVKATWTTGLLWCYINHWVLIMDLKFNMEQ